MSTLQEIEAAVLRLSDKDRLQLADKLLGSLPASPAAESPDDILNEAVRRRLEEIRVGVQRASDMMTNISDGAREQERELAEVTSSMSQIGTLTQRTAANAEESASAAAELSAQAGEMHDLASQFTLDGVLAPTSASLAQQRLAVRRRARERADSDFDIVPPSGSGRATIERVSAERNAADDEAYRVLTQF